MGFCSQGIIKIFCTRSPVCDILPGINRFSSFFFYLSFFIIPVITYASSDSLSSINGRVLNSSSGQPVNGVAIFLEPGNRFAETDQNGHFKISNLKAGRYHLLIQRIGYSPERLQSIRLNPGENKKVDISLNEKIIVASDPIVVTARRNQFTTLEIPYSKDVVTAEQMGLNNPLNLSESLKNIQGTFIKDYGGLGDLKTISLRGSSAEQVLIMLDGQRLNNPQTGQVDLSSLRLDGIDNIEILRGGSSAMYGSDAVGGVINIITKKNRDAEGFNAELEVLGGSFHTRSLKADMGLSQDCISVFLGYHELKSKGDFTFQNIQGEEEERHNNDIESENLYADLAIRLSKNHFPLDLKISYKYYNSEHGAPGTIEMPSLSARQWDVNHQVQGLLTGSIFNPLHDFRLQVYGYQNKSGYKSDDGLVPVDSKFNSASTGVEYNMESILSPQNALNYGIGFKQDQMKDLQLATTYNRRTFYAFVQDEATLIPEEANVLFSVILIPALRFDNYSDIGARWTPKFGGILGHGELWRTMIKFNMGMSFRVPTFNELYWPADIWSRGNPNLTPEKGSDWDVGINLRYPLLDGFALDIVYFDMHMEDLILWQPVNQIWQPENIARSRTRGIEASSSLGLLQKNLTVSANYTFLEATNQSEVAALKDKYLVYRPNYTFNISLYYTWRSFRLGAEFHNVGRRYTNPANTIYLDPYHVSDLTLQWQKQFVNWQPGIRLQIKNILDSPYEVIKFQPMPGREVRLSLSINYK